MELLFELLLQILFEGGGEAVFRALAAPFEKRPHPVWLAIGYALLGAGAGGASIFLLSQGVLQTPEQRIAYLMLSPLVLAATMVWLRRNLRARETISSSDAAYFCASALFGFCFALVRYLAIY